MLKTIANLVQDESGVTAIEYGLIAALIVIVIIGVLSQVGTGLSTKFESVASNL